VASVTKNGFSLSWEVDEGKSLPGWSSRAAAGQGLTLVHFSAQPEPVLSLKQPNIAQKVLTLS